MKVLLLLCTLLVNQCLIVGYPISWWSDDAPYVSHDRLVRRVQAYGDDDCYPFIPAEDELAVERPVREAEVYQRMIAEDGTLPHTAIMPNRMFRFHFQDGPANSNPYLYTPGSRAYMAADDVPRERLLVLEPEYYELPASNHRMSLQLTSSGDTDQCAAKVNDDKVAEETPNVKEQPEKEKKQDQQEQKEQQSEQQSRGQKQLKREYQGKLVDTAEE